MPAHRRSRRGFSLIELVTMLAIVGVLAAIASPRYANSLAVYRTQAAAQRIAADLNLARWQAKATSGSQSVVFNFTTHSYTLPGVAGLSGELSAYTVRLSAEPYAATLVLAPLMPTTFTFDRYGQPSAGGTVTVQAGGFSKIVAVNAVTGEASVP